MRRLDRPLTLAVAGFVVALLAAGRLDGALASAPRAAPAQRAATQGPSVTATIDLGAPAGGLVATARALWALPDDARFVAEIDPRTAAIVRMVDIPGLSVLDDPVARLAAGAGAVWVLDGAGTLWRINPVNGAATPLGNRATRGRRGTMVAAGAIAAGAGAVWVGCCAGGGRSWLLRVDPASGRVIGRVALPDVAQQLAVGAGAVWVTGYPGRLWRVDPTTDRVVASVRLGGDPLEVAAGAGAVWVTVSDGQWRDASGVIHLSALLRIDPKTDRIVTTIPLDTPGGLAVGAGAVWLLQLGDPSGYLRVARVAPATGALTGSEVVPVRDASGLAVTGGALWFAAITARAVVRVGPLPAAAR